MSTIQTGSVSLEAARSVPGIVSQLAYRDLDAALAWLERVFGFRERREARFLNPDGSVGHAEMETLWGTGFMLGQGGGHGLASPRDVGAGTQFLAVYVDDVDAHCERARAAGAAICAELEDKPWGDRAYEVEDLEGHRWMFCQHLRDVPPEEWHVSE